VTELLCWTAGAPPACARCGSQRDCRADSPSSPTTRRARAVLRSNVSQGPRGARRPRRTEVPQGVVADADPSSPRPSVRDASRRGRTVSLARSTRHRPTENLGAGSCALRAGGRTASAAAVHRSRAASLPRSRSASAGAIEYRPDLPPPAGIPARSSRPVSPTLEIGARRRRDVTVRRSRVADRPLIARLRAEGRWFGRALGARALRRPSPEIPMPRSCRVVHVGRGRSERVLKRSRALRTPSPLTAAPEVAQIAEQSDLVITGRRFFESDLRLNRLCRRSARSLVRNACSCATRRATIDSDDLSARGSAAILDFERTWRHLRPKGGRDPRALQHLPSRYYEVLSAVL